jgi:hypothetical protein
VEVALDEAEGEDASGEVVSGVSGELVSGGADAVDGSSVGVGVAAVQLTVTSAWRVPAPSVYVAVTTPEPAARHSIRRTAPVWLSLWTNEGTANDQEGVPVPPDTDPVTSMSPPTAVDGGSASRAITGSARASSAQALPSPPARTRDPRDVAGRSATARTTMAVTRDRLCERPTCRGWDTARTFPLSAGRSIPTVTLTEHPGEDVGLRPSAPSTDGACGPGPASVADGDGVRDTRC